MTRVLITGAGGFIGRSVIAARPGGWDLVALSRQPGEAAPGLTPVPLTEGPLPRPCREPFDAVIHLAGNADHGLAVREPWTDLAATGVLAARLLCAVRARHIVVLSSAAVYAGLEGRVGPDRCVEPPMAYALSKRYVEGFVSTLVATGRTERACIIRLYNAFGPGERATRLVPRVAAAVRGQNSFTLTGDPSSLSDPVYVADVARCLIGAVETELSGTFDLCGGDPRPLEEQVGRIAHALGAPAPPIDQVPDPDQVPIHFWSDPASLLAALGGTTLMTFPDGVRRYARAERWSD